MKIRSILLLSLSAAQVVSINPITVSGRKFIDSVTGEEFFIKGVDYQPGGSSLSSKDGDPLSNSKTCARDIALFQKLKINTVRVYNIDTSLNHDECMSLLAAAGIYLVLDVNSPLTNRHLNRYEPWSTYTRDYLKNIFQVVQQFSTYNNTLGFFAGNEIVNDPTSATKAPIYVKAVIRDLKNYIKNNLIRKIPVGYSAADNLDYRISLSKYLECSNNNPSETVDFYGVNSYQWCGDQTFYTSGYNILVDAYKDYSKPVFFSEYGCNVVRPRLFTEVKSIYSPQMTGVFKGGLVYEFTEEPNNYGLVKVLPNKNLQLLQDFHLAILQFNSISSVIKYRDKETKKRDVPPKCQKSYRNLFVTKNLPPCVAQDLVNKGVKVLQGSYVELTEELVQSPYKIFNVDGTLMFMENPRVEVIMPVYPHLESISGTYTLLVEPAPYGVSDSEDTDESESYQIGENESEYSEGNDYQVVSWSLSDDDEEAKISLFKMVSLGIHRIWHNLLVKVDEALMYEDTERFS